MALDFGAGQPVTSSAAVSIGQIPAGVCTAVISNTTPSAGTAATAYLGGSGVTAANGWPLPTGTTVTVAGYPGSRPFQLYAIAGTGGSIAVALLVSTAG
jgi:hypothetical protein